MSKPNPVVWPGMRYATPSGDVIVYRVLPVGRGYQVHAIERVIGDLMPADQFLRRLGQEAFMRRHK